MLDMGETMAAVQDRDTLTEILKRRRRFQRAFRRQYWFTEPRRRRQMRRLVAHYERKGLKRCADGFVDWWLLPPF